MKLQPQETGAWIVAEIRPGGSSGGLYIQSRDIKAEAGEFVDNGVRPSLVVQVGGQWNRLDLLSGEAPTEGRFQWKSAAELRGLALGIESWTATQGRIAFLFGPGDTGRLAEKLLKKRLSFDPSPANEESWQTWQKILAAPGIQKGQSSQTNE